MNGLKTSLSLFFSQGQGQHGPQTTGAQDLTMGFRPSPPLPSSPAEITSLSPDSPLQLDFQQIFTLPVSNSGLIR